MAHNPAANDPVAGLRTAVRKLHTRARRNRAIDDLLALVVAALDASRVASPEPEPERQPASRILGLTDSDWIADMTRVETLADDARAVAASVALPDLVVRLKELSVVVSSTQRRIPPEAARPLATLMILTIPPAGLQELEIEVADEAWHRVRLHGRLIVNDGSLDIALRQAVHLLLVRSPPMRTEARWCRCTQGSVIVSRYVMDGFTRPMRLGQQRTWRRDFYRDGMTLLRNAGVTATVAAHQLAEIEQTYAGADAVAAASAGRQALRAEGELLKEAASAGRQARRAEGELVKELEAHIELALSFPRRADETVQDKAARTHLQLDPGRRVHIHGTVRDEPWVADPCMAEIMSDVRAWVRRSTTVFIDAVAGALPDSAYLVPRLARD